MKRALFILAFSVLIFGLIISYDITQCDGQVIVSHFIHNDYEPVLEEPYEYEPIKPEKTTDKGQDYFGDAVIEKKETEITPDISPKDAVEEEVVEDHTEEDSNRGYEFYFALLDDQEKDVYRAMYNAFSNIESGNTIPTVDEESMNRVAGYIRMDHPEFFYANDLGYTHYTM